MKMQDTNTLKQKENQSLHELKGVWRDPVAIKQNEPELK